MGLAAADLLEMNWLFLFTNGVTILLYEILLRHSTVPYLPLQLVRITQYCGEDFKTDLIDSFIAID